MSRKRKPPVMTVGKLREMLAEWPDDSPVDVWLSTFDKEGYFRGPTVSGFIREVVLVAEGNPPFAMIAGTVSELSFDDCQCWEEDI